MGRDKRDVNDFLGATFPQVEECRRCHQIARVLRDCHEWSFIAEHKIFHRRTRFKWFKCVREDKNPLKGNNFSFLCRFRQTFSSPLFSEPNSLLNWSRQPAAARLHRGWAINTDVRRFKWFAHQAIWRVPLKSLCRLWAATCWGFNLSLGQLRGGINLQSHMRCEWS